MRGGDDTMMRAMRSPFLAAILCAAFSDGLAAKAVAIDGPAASPELRAASEHWDAGVGMVLIGKPQTARLEWEACLRLDPENRDCRAGLRLLRGVAAAGKGSGKRLLSDRANALYVKGNYAAAREAASEALKHDPHDPVAKAVLSLVGAGGDSKAAPTTEIAARSAVAHWNSGIIYFQKGDYSRARDEWLLCKTLDPTNNDCQTGLQRIDNTFGGP